MKLFIVEKFYDGIKCGRSRVQAIDSCHAISVCKATDNIPELEYVAFPV